MKRWDCARTMLATLVVGVSLPAREPSAVTPTTAINRADDPAVTPAGLAAALLTETNRVRHEHGCRLLRPRRELNAAADDQASYMALTLSATHSSAVNGQSNALERVMRHGFTPGQVAENVASLPAYRAGDPSPCTTLAVRLVEAWLNSPGHRANLLNPRFIYFGCAARVTRGLGGVEYVFGAQVFSTAPPATEGLR